MEIGARFSEAVLSDPGIKHIGVSDSGYLLLNDLDWALGTKVILVNRDFRDAVRSFMDFFQTPYPGLGRPAEAQAHAVLLGMQRRLWKVAEIVPQELLRIVQYRDLDEGEKCRQLWSFICPEEPFSLARWRTLDLLRINPATEKVKAQASTFALRSALQARKAAA